ncbi:signal recognition particle-docking protein FtsY [archaeon]|jgi:fused signal recognition particle receptor|nr:signal recognition particle-docking protein FtsY [archaeon]MBT6182674.1 signal recognition particle-docking protein FtsY [archaeon]MBT6606193.1 signal recognition particle-docking protein FtsY [archaeon]MBT7251638.1 signal recognition particle-docking protein FtsY [archaeon]MBT7661072.1 signal recognition particle-docking protein FtsY [archaeon]
MFGKLRDKLKGWVSKAEEEVELDESLEEVGESVEKKDEEVVEEKKVEKKKESKKKENKVKEKSVEEPSKKGFLKKVFGSSEDVEKEDVEKILKESETEKAEEKIALPGVPQNLEGKEKTVKKKGKPLKKSFLSKFKKEITSENFDELFEKLEMILLQHNVAYSAVEAIKESLETRLVGKTFSDVNLSEELKLAITGLLLDSPDFLETIRKSLEEKKPFVILFAGINGSGKTTTVAKVANYLLKNNLTICLAAGDTFRAASIEQIQAHADKLGVHLIKKDYGSDPAAVGFDAVTYAKKNKIDVVLIDTAGRMQNKDSLMQEIEKVTRVNKPDMKIFLGESITGNDATEQATKFNEAIDLTGIILSKADVDENGGAAISVSKATGKPILFLGTGQGYDDLEVFDKDKLIEKLGL